MPLIDELIKERIERSNRKNTGSFTSSFLLDYIDSCWGGIRKVLYFNGMLLMFTTGLFWWITGNLVISTSASGFGLLLVYIHTYYLKQKISK